MSNIIILGAGGHAKVLIDAIETAASFNIVGLTDSNPSAAGQELLGKKILGDDSILSAFPAKLYNLANGIGSVNTGLARQKIYEYFKTKNYHFPFISHPSAVISQYANLAEAVQVMAGAVIQAGTIINQNTLINTCASIDHDCKIGRHVHIAPGVTISGGVEIADGCHIGTGAVIIQGIKIGENSLIAAGAVVVKDVPAGSKVIGVPGRAMK